MAIAGRMRAVCLYAAGIVFVAVAIVCCGGCSGDDEPDPGPGTPDSAGTPDSRPTPDVSDPGCPDPMAFGPGEACSIFPAYRECFHMNSFSSCLSGMCRCVGGQWDCDGLGAVDGASCAGSPLDFCSYEGTGSCDTPPTAEGCSCGEDGTWHCACACYGGSGAGNTCGPTCPDRFIPEMNGAHCEAPFECDYPEVTCTCIDDGLDGRLDCVSS